MGGGEGMCHDSDIGTDYFSFVISLSHYCSLSPHPLVPECYDKDLQTSFYLFKLSVLILES